MLYRSLRPISRTKSKGVNPRRLFFRTKASGQVKYGQTCSERSLPLPMFFSFWFLLLIFSVNGAAREFQQFVPKEKSADRHPRILPVLWIEIPSLANPHDDDIAKSLSEIQRDDWHILRHKKWDSEEIRQRIDALASKAIELAARVK